MQTPPRVAIVAILKNEEPYLLEWLAHWRLMGVSRFFLADNGGDDNASDLLKRLDRAQIVTRIPWPTPKKGPVQMRAYAKIRETYGRTVDWMLIVDGDEFLLLEPPLKTVADLIAAVGEGADAIGLNWAIYGSSGLTATDDRLVQERFTQRAEKDFSVNLHLKCMFKPDAVLKMVNPHAPELKPGRKFVDSNGAPLVIGPPGHSGSVVWGKARLNHYVVKSRAEFEKKRDRGRADGGKPRDDDFFVGHDRNDVHDPMPAEAVAATKAEMARIEELLRPTIWRSLRHAVRRLGRAVSPGRRA